MMNDSLSVSSSSSSNNSNSNSLNRSLILNVNGNFSLRSTQKLEAIENTINSDYIKMNQSNTSKNFDSLFFRNTTRISSDYLHLQITPVKRRSKSQVVYYGDENNTIAEHNKQLIEDLYLLKKQLKQRDDQIIKLNDIRDKLESEIQELSASLFEQAYQMVNTAKAETAQAEKLLKEANGKIDVLQAEVIALKQLIITSTPSTPNKHLHPHLLCTCSSSSISSIQQQRLEKKSHSRQSSWNQQSINTMMQSSNSNNSLNSQTNNIGLVAPPASTSTPSSNNSKNSLANNLQIVTTSSNETKNLMKSSSSTSQQLSNLLKEKSASFFNKSHKRVPSHNDVPLQPTKSIVDKLFQSNSLPNKQKSNNSLNFGQSNHHFYEDVHEIEEQPYKTVEIIEFDPIYFRELEDWKVSPELKLKSQFMNRIYEEDILPCLSFQNKKLSDELLESIESNSVCIEDLNNSSQVLQAENFAQVCALSNIPSICQYKIKLSEKNEWLLISKLSRNRIISVCDFYTYLRYIKDGLVKSDINEKSHFIVPYSLTKYSVTSFLNKRKRQIIRISE